MSRRRTKRSPLANPVLLAVIEAVLDAYLFVLLKLVRWRHVDFDRIEPFTTGAVGPMPLFWHGRLPLALAIRPKGWTRPIKALVSPSTDGDVVVRGLARHGTGAVRGSSAKRGDSAKARAAAGAFREAIAWLNTGEALTITPDGPRGPHEVISPGVVHLARHTGAPVLLVGLAASPSLVVRFGWDRMMFAMPGARGVVLWDGPLFVPADADDAAVEALAAEWSERLRAVTRRAEALARGD